MFEPIEPVFLHCVNLVTPVSMATTAVLENQYSRANELMQDGVNWSASNVPVMCWEACQILGKMIDVDTSYN